MFFATEQIIDYSSIVENANEMIIRFDTDFRHIYCNQAVEKQLGLPKNILLGKSPQEIGGPPDQVKVITQSLQKTLDSQQEQEVEQSYPTPIHLRNWNPSVFKRGINLHIQMICINRMNFWKNISEANWIIMNAKPE